MTGGYPGSRLGAFSMQACSGARWDRFGNLHNFNIFIDKMFYSLPVSGYSFAGTVRFNAVFNRFYRNRWIAMLKDMKTYSHLKPGQKGTRQLVEQYGPALLCVRYRFDKKRGIRLKTVEIVVEEKPLIAPRFKDEDVVPVSVAFEETELREQLRKMHAKWDPRLKVWFARYRLIRGTALESRIVAE